MSVSTRKTDIDTTTKQQSVHRLAIVRGNLRMLNDKQERETVLHAVGGVRHLLSHAVCFLRCKRKKPLIPFLLTLFFGLFRLMVCLMLTVPSVSSCVSSDLLDCSLAYIVIKPTDHNYNLPGLRYHFYRKDGRIATTILPCDGRGIFSGRLMSGDYWVIATNIHAENSIFTDMEDYETAAVHARRLNSHADSGSTATDTYTSTDTYTDTRSTDYYLAYPGEVYAISLEHLSIGGRDTIRLAPKPVLLTKTISLKFKIGSNLDREAIGLKGELQGVYPSLNLYTGQPSDHCLAASQTTVTRFAATGAGDDWQAQISLLGICDPEYGARYRNIMHFTLSTTDGDLPVAVELTDVLSDIIKKNEGTIPLEVPIEITIQHNGILLEAEARPWVDSGSGEGNVN